MLLIYICPLVPRATRIKDDIARISWAWKLERRVGESTLVQQLLCAWLCVKHHIHANSPNLDSTLLKRDILTGLPSWVLIHMAPLFTWPLSKWSSPSFFIAWYRLPPEEAEAARLLKDQTQHWLKIIACLHLVGQGK